MVAISPTALAPSGPPRPAPPELVLIAADTTIRGLRDALRWNQACYRLAQGF